MMEYSGCEPVRAQVRNFVSMRHKQADWSVADWAAAGGLNEITVISPIRLIVD